MQSREKITKAVESLVHDLFVIRDNSLDLAVDANDLPEEALEGKLLTTVDNLETTLKNFKERIQIQE